MMIMDNRTDERNVLFFVRPQAGWALSYQGTDSVMIMDNPAYEHNGLFVRRPASGAGR